MEAKLQANHTIEEHLVTPLVAEYDVVVVGGGASGTVAAMAAARGGARTLVLERGGCLGGAATSNLIAQWVGYFHGDTRVVGGIPFELATRVEAAGGSAGFHRYVMGEAAGTPFGLKVLPFNPEVLKVVLDAAVAAGFIASRHRAMIATSNDPGELLDQLGQLRIVGEGVLGDDQR